MAKIKAKQIVDIDLSKTENVDYKGKDKVALNFTGAENLTGISITSDGKNLYFYKGEDLIGTVTNSKKIKSTKFNSDASFTTDVIDKKVAYTGVLNIKKNKVTGSNYNDTVDFSNPEVYQTGLTIKTGNGDDTIKGSQYKDNITGGKGENTINYEVSKQFGHDIINLTKGETLNLNFNIEGSNVDLFSLEFSQGTGKKGKNDLIIKSDKNNSVTLKNYYGKTTGATVFINGVDFSSVNILNGFNSVDITDNKIKSYTGSALADIISAAELNEPTSTKKSIQYGVTINGAAGTDTITGSKYADTLKAGTGTGDTLEGGKDNDTLYASTTKDSITTFVFSEGDGNDTVYSGKGEDIIKFNDIQLENITMLQGTGKNNKDLVIKYTNSDTVTIKNYYKVNKKGAITGINNSNSIKYITTTDGTFALSDYTDKFKFGWGKGLADSQHNTITMNPASIQDAIMFNKNATIKNLKFIREGNNLRIWYNDDEIADALIDAASDTVHTIDDVEVYKVNNTYMYCSSVIIKDYFTSKTQTIDNIILKYDDAWTHKETVFSIANDSIASNNGETGFENIEHLDDPESVVLGTYKDNTYTGTKYADLVYTKTGSGDGDTVYTGDGNDFVYTWGRSDSVYTQNGNDTVYGNTSCPVIDLGAGNDKVLFSNSSGANPNEYVTIIGGTGDDDLTGYDSKKQVFEFNKGDGDDTVTSTSGLDALKFNDVELSELEFVKDGDDIVINYGTSDKITLVNAIKKLITINIEDMNGDKTTALEGCHIIKGSGTFEGTDNADIIYGSAEEDDTITSKKGNDEIYGKAGDDTFVFNNSDGHDTIYQGVAGDVDTIKFADSLLQNLDFIKSGENDLKIYYNNNSDSVTVKDYFVAGNTVTKWTDANGMTYDIATTNRHAIDSAEETVNGTVFNDVITVNPGNTNIDGKEGANRYIISQNGIYNITSTSGRDTIEFSNVELDTLNFNVSGDNVIIRNSTNSLRVIITDYLVNMPTLYVKGQTGEPATIITQLASAGIIYSDASTINGNAGTADRIFGGDSANTIDGKGGGDTINGGKGNDIIQIKKGYGGTTVINGTETNEVDTLQFMDSTLEELDYEVNGTDLIIKYNGGEDSVTIKGYYADLNTVKNLITTDGEYSLSDIKHIIVADSTTINGTDLDDKIYGTSGDDTIYSSKGNDIIIGGNGEDIFEITKWGDGFADRQHTTIIMGTDSKQDTIKFNAEDFAGNLRNFVFEKEGDNLVIWYNDDHDIEDISELDYEKVLYRGSYIYRVGNYAYCSTLTIKDYFTADQTIDKIVINRYADPGDSKEYSILNDSIANNNGCTGFENHIDLDKPENIQIGTYENNVCNGTKYADLIYTKRGNGDGDTIYSGEGNDFVYTWGRTDTVYTGNGNDQVYGNAACLLIDLGAGDDKTFFSYSSTVNPNGYIKVYGGTGSDDIKSDYGVLHIYTNSEEGGKDLTEDTTDVVNLQYNSNNGNVIYAQSQTNTITGSKGDDSFFAYIDQKTSIDAKAGNDLLTITNTSGETDGNKSNLHIMFNVEAGYNYDEADAETLFGGNILLTETATKSNYDLWTTNEGYKGISVIRNSVETIKSSDETAYTLSNTDISTLAENVATWLTSGGRNFADVSDVFENGTEDEITALIAEFDNANWQTV